MCSIVSLSYIFQNGNQGRSWRAIWSPPDLCNGRLASGAVQVASTIDSTTSLDWRYHCLVQLPANYRASEAIYARCLCLSLYSTITTISGTHKLIFNSACMMISSCMQMTDTKWQLNGLRCPSCSMHPRMKDMRLWEVMMRLFNLRMNKFVTLLMTGPLIPYQLDNVILWKANSWQ